MEETLGAHCRYLREVEVVQPSTPVETLVTVHEAGQFTGEVGTLTGRGSLFRVRATKQGEVIELDRQQMLACTNYLRRWRKYLVASQTVEVDAAGVLPWFPLETHYQGRKTALATLYNV